MVPDERLTGEPVDEAVDRVVGEHADKVRRDVVDLALLAVFGDPFGLDPSGANGKDALTTDNVPFDSPGVTATFPYLAPPN